MSSGTWEGNPSSYTDQWQSCAADGSDCVDITGANGSSYGPSALDVGRVLQVIVTATGTDASATANSLLSAVVTAAAQPTGPVSTTTVQGPTTTVQGPTTTVTVQAPTVPAVAAVVPRATVKAGLTPSSRKRSVRRIRITITVVNHEADGQARASSFRTWLRVRGSTARVRQP